MLLNFFQKWLDYDKMVYGVYIYYVMISYNSVFEYEDTKMTEYYLRVIHDIETKVISKLTK